MLPTWLRLLPPWFPSWAGGNRGPLFGLVFPPGGPSPSGLTLTRATSKYQEYPASALTLVANNVASIEAAGLVVEAAHTNIALQSQTFDSAGVWTPSSSGAVPVVTANAAIAPDGTLTADQIDYKTAVPPGGWSDLRSGVAAADGTYTFSCWLKAGTTNATNLRVGSNVTGTQAVACALTSTWQRFFATVVASGGTTAMALRIGNDGAGIVPQGLGTIFAWGAQLEAKAFPQSYVPTVAASAACNADIASVSTVTALPVAAGSLELDFTPEWATGTLPAHAVLLDTTANHTKGLELDIAAGAPTVFFAGVSSAGSVLTWVAGETYRMRLVWGGGTFTLYRDGVVVLTGSATMPSSHGTLYLGCFNGASSLADGRIQRVLFYA